MKSWLQFVLRIAVAMAGVRFTRPNLKACEAKGRQRSPRLLQEYGIGRQSSWDVRLLT